MERKSIYVWLQSIFDLEESKFRMQESLYYFDYIFVYLSINI